MRKAILPWVLGILCISLLQGADTPGQAPKFDKVQAGRIAQVVARILENAHFAKSPVNDRVSTNFFRNYVDALDYNHQVFLQSDINDLEVKYARNLDDLTLAGDISPAFAIFDLYLKRLVQRHDLAQELVKETYDFTQDETTLRIRNKAPWPKDEAEARQIWRGRIKYELLQERLAKAKTNTTASASKKSKDTPPKSAASTNASALAKRALDNDPVKKIAKRYERLLRNTREFETEDIVQIYLTALSHAYDPHTDYMSPTEASNFDINNIKLSLSGIGARLRWEDGFTKVESLLPGGPAEIDGKLKPNDRIIAVAQGDAEPVETIDMKLSKVVDMIRGPRGTEVRLTIIPGDATDDAQHDVITLIRDEIKLKEQLAKAQVIDHPDAQGKTRRIGIIQLPQFYDNCAEHIEKLLTRLKTEKVEGVVLDLRRNGGGLLDEAITLAGLFIKDGPIVQVKESRGPAKVFPDADEKVAYDGPLVVMVSRVSASASEIVAAALQDYGRALVIGDESTHGKGTVQSMLSLSQFIRGDNFPNPGKIKLTVSKFYRIEGGTTQKNGVHPDVVLPSLYDGMEIGEAFLPNCLPSDRIEPAEYARENRVLPYLKDLTTRSKSRVQADKDFGYLRDDIERLKKQREEKTVSLNENKVKREREELEAREKARKEERTARKAPTDKIYEVSLDIIEQNKPMVEAGLKPKAGDKLAAGSSTPKATDPDADPDEDEEVDPSVDAHLRESMNIVRDWLDLIGGQRLTAIGNVEKN